MKHLLFLSLLFCSLAAHSEIKRSSQWGTSIGLGPTWNPGGFALSPKMEFRKTAQIHYGALLQMAFGGPDVLTFTPTWRYHFWSNPRGNVPYIEAGIGVAYNRDEEDAPVYAAHFLMSGGIDFHITRRMRLGIVFRANFAVPASPFFWSTPIYLTYFL